MRSLIGHKERMRAAREAAPRYAERYKSAEPGTNAKDLAMEAGINVSSMLDILRAQGVDFEAVKEARRISLVRPYGGKQSPSTPRVRREPDMAEMIAACEALDD